MAIAGAAPPRPLTDALRFARQAFASLTLKLAGLVGIFIALPIVLYGQFEAADRHAHDLVIRSMKDRTWLVTQLLAPMLDQPDGPRYAQLNRELAKYAGPGTTLRLLLQPLGVAGADSFYYVASAPAAMPQQIGAELKGLAEQEILARLSESCSWDRPIDLRYAQADGREELLTSLVPIKSRWGCFLLVSVHDTAEYLNTSIGRPYWRTPEIRFAAISYLVFALLAALMALSVSRSLHHFRRVTREMRKNRHTGSSFADQKVAPELTSVAQDFDGLVHDLKATAQGIRQRAEDHAHSIKAPLGTITLSLEPIKRSIPGEETKARRAIALIEMSLERMRLLVNSAQRLDRTTADLIDAPRLPIDLTAVVNEVLLRHRQQIQDKSVQIRASLAESVTVPAGKGVLDVVVENILDNALSFSPIGATILVSLERDEDTVLLRIGDEGPGIKQSDLERIFDRYFSQRPRPSPEADAMPRYDHAGLGLWIVQRNVSALNGHVSARNRSPRGLIIEVELPTA